jgi:hypothetical protein
VPDPPGRDDTTPWLVLDPGKATGVVFAHAGELRADILDKRAVWRALRVFGRLCRDIGGGVVICERFTITERTIRAGRDDTALRLIGCAEWVADQSGCDFLLQAPNEAKRLVPDWRLTALGLYAPGPADHHRDALRHYVFRRAQERSLTLPVMEVSP